MKAGTRFSKASSLVAADHACWQSRGCAHSCHSAAPGLGQAPGCPWPGVWVDRRAPRLPSPGQKMTRLSQLPRGALVLPLEPLSAGRESLIGAQSQGREQDTLQTLPGTIRPLWQESSSTYISGLRRERSQVTLPFHLPGWPQGQTATQIAPRSIPGGSGFQFALV